MSEVLRPNFEINLSLASQLTDKNPAHLVRPDAFYTDQAEQAGYEGLEWHPMSNFTRIGRQENSGNLSSFTYKFIHSAHQSFRGEETILDVIKHEHKFYALGSFLLFPHTDKSLVRIEKLQENAGKKLPVVVYPDTVTGRYEWNFADKSYQPYKPVMREFGATDIPDMIKKGKERGFDSVTIDIHHMLELGSWQEVLPQLLPHTSEIHLSVGRVDEDKDPKTLQKLEDLYFARKGTEIYQILEAIKKSGWIGRIVTEIPFDGIKSIRQKNKDRMDTTTLTEDHRRIVDNVREVFQ